MAWFVDVLYYEWMARWFSSPSLPCFSCRGFFFFAWTALSAFTLLFFSIETTWQNTVLSVESWCWKACTDLKTQRLKLGLKERSAWQSNGSFGEQIEPPILWLKPAGCVRLAISYILKQFGNVDAFTPEHRKNGDERPHTICQLATPTTKQLLECSDPRTDRKCELRWLRHNVQRSEKLCQNGNSLP